MIYNVMTIAGSDSGGGAGIQADIKTFSALGVYSTSVVTALTAQNTQVVADIHSVPSEFIQSQFRTVVKDIRIDAIKVGMLGTRGVIDVVADCLSSYACKSVVVDPVMVAKSGDKLLQDDAINALKTNLLPRATLITPNIPEAMVLTGVKALQTDRQMLACAQSLREFGVPWVLLKGGHLEGRMCRDVLVGPETSEVFESARIETNNTHGTGCTLSSAIAAFLATGVDMQAAVSRARQYLYGAIAGADKLRVGHGHGPVHHFHKDWSA